MDVASLIEQLTLEEKVQLTAGTGWWHTTAIDRLSIPSIRLSDGPNGVRGTHFFDSTPSACLPCGTALGATFDTGLAERVGRLLSDEAHAKGAHVLLGPTVNIQRGPLGGRGFESFSEDPVLSGIIAGHYVRGVQKSGVSATLKHFVCNDMESERMAVDVQVTERALREVYLLPFMIAIEMANPRAIMTAYNKVNGSHAPENRHLLQNILRDEWKWDGLVMSDWYGTYSTSAAIRAGQDLEMPGPSRWREEALVHAVTANKVKRQELDERVRNVLTLIKHSLENTTIPTNAPEGEANTPEHIQLLREAAAKSLVLLKNDRNILPLNPAKRVAVIGPNANIATYCGGGSASLRGYRTVTPLEGIRGLAKNVEFAQGAYGHQSLPLLGKKLRTADGENTGFKLRVYNEPKPTEGEDTRRVLEERLLDDSNMWFVDYEHPDLNKVWYAETEGILTPETSGEWDFGLSVHGTAQLFIDDKLVVSNVENQRNGGSFAGCGSAEEMGSARLEAGQSYRILVRWGSSLTSGRKVSGVVDFGQGGLRFSGCPRLDADAAVEEAVALAKTVDQVVICAGLSGEWECEGQDRSHMRLPPGTDELIAAVIKANPNTVVVIQSGTPVSMPWIEDAGAVVQAWFGGNEGGNGIADVLFGVVNPAGKLPLTMPRRLADNPSALSFRSDNGRVLYSEDIYVGYRWYDTLDIEPLFAFGHGLSYTSFEVSDLKIGESGDRLKGSDAPNLKVQVNVRNTGPRAGAEVVQIYVKPAAPTPITGTAGNAIARPAKELKGFTKVHIEAGETAVAEIDMDFLRATSYWSEMEHCWRSDAGSYTILVDELCPRPLFNVIINDYLQRIYPLVPVVHRPTFKAELASDRDVTDTEYLCLVLSLVALTVGLLPSRFDQYRSMAPELMDRFPTRSTMINYCAQMCTRLRPAGYWDHVNHRKWAVCYCLSIGVFQTGQTNHSRMLEVEAAQFARLLGTHRISEYEGLNCIEKQLRKKAFWLQFYGFAHSLIHVGRREQLVFLDHYTLRDVNFAALTPLDVEDEMITDTTVFHPTSLDHTTPLTNESHVFDAPKSAFTCVSAFIATSQVFFKAVQEALFHVSCDCGTNRTPELRLSRLRDLFRDLQYMLDDLPVSMRQWVFAEDACQARDDFGAATDTAEIAHAQREITRANLHFTHLWLQNFLLEKMDMILQQQASEADGTPETARASEALRTNWTAREDICRQTLHLLHSIPHVYLEPNGLYLAYKVRDVAVALLNCPFEAHEGPSRRAAEYMRDFTSILSRLDRSEIMNTASLKSWVDKDRETSR
ncbi:hypothetical protein ACHAQA_007058 [Verticillium albo-atrum]